MSKNITELKVLNIAQPFAHCVFHKGKNIENRTKTTNIRGTIAIYASKTKRKALFENQNDPIVKPEDCDFGAIIGLVDLVDCIVSSQVTDQTEGWFNGPFGWVLENPRLLPKPISVAPPKGAVIWWPLKGSLVDEVLEQVEASSILPIKNVEVSQEVEKVRKARNQKYLPSKDLAEIVGEEPLTSEECFMELLYYIKSNKLKIDGDPPELKTDEKLKKIFQVDQLTYLEISPYVWDHLEEV